jgi:hypothetical protein
MTFALTIEASKPVLFTDLSTADLRTMAQKDGTGFTKIGWHEWDRAMLLAFLHNRYPDGIVPDGL